MTAPCHWLVSSKSTPRQVFFLIFMFSLTTLAQVLYWTETLWRLMLEINHVGNQILCFSLSKSELYIETLTFGWKMSALLYLFSECPADKALYNVNHQYDTTKHGGSFLVPHFFISSGNSSERFQMSSRCLEVNQHSLETRQTFQLHVAVICDHWDFLSFRGCLLGGKSLLSCCDSLMLWTVFRSIQRITDDKIG